MGGHFSQFLPPPEALKILIVLVLSFLIGLEREEHKGDGDYSFGGVRTFPLIGLVGYAVALLSKDQLLPLSIGFAVVGAFLLMSYRHKLSGAQTLAESPGVTTEISGLTTYVLGALVSNGYYWISAAIAVLSLFLLELKGVLEGLSKRLAPHEILTFTKFLLLTAVILPTVPNAPFTEFGSIHSRRGYWLSACAGFPTEATCSSLLPGRTTEYFCLDYWEVSIPLPRPRLRWRRKLARNRLHICSLAGS